MISRVIRGYEAGLAERTIQQVLIQPDQAPPTTTTNPTPQATMRDTIVAQIEALEDLKNFLKQFSTKIEHERRDYHRYVEAVLECGGVERQITP